MSPDPSAPSSLDAALAALPRDLAPECDLWPGIRAAISPVPAATPLPAWRRPLALAAGVSVATVAALVAWQLRRVPEATDRPAAGAPPAVLAEEADLAVPRGAEYRETRVALEEAYRDRLARLPPATRARVESDLETIRAANADIRRALAADPGSPVLNRLLAGIWQQEFDFYVAVARSPDVLTQRTGT